MIDFIKNFFVIESKAVLIGQIIGIVAMIESFFIYQQKSHKVTLFLKGIDDIMWCIHYFLIGGYSGALINLVSIPRAIVFYNNDKKWASHKIWIVLFITVTCASSALTWQGPISLLPCIGSSLAIIGFASHSVKVTRLLGIPANALWIFYGVASRSYGGILANSIILVSIIIGILRLDVKHKKEKAEASVSSDKS